MRSRRPPEPPAGLQDHVSRREAARLLGFASEFPIRQLEKEGRLRSVRGAMGQAWYPRSAVLELSPPSGTGAPNARDPLPAPSGPSARGAWSDAELIGLLRELVPAPLSGGRDPGAARPRTAVDLVADAGIAIARAARIHRFWLTNDRHPTAELARAQAGLSPPGGNRVTLPAAFAPEAQLSTPPLQPPASPSAALADPGGRGTERRGSDRVERERLIRRLRDPDPAVRALAFEKLRPRQKS